MQSIDLEEAVYFLMSAERHVTYATDDATVAPNISWAREGRLVAFSKDENNLNICIDDKAQLFTGEDSARLRKLGIVVAKVTHKMSDFPSTFTFDLAQKM
jgi:hypothetical protein